MVKVRNMEDEEFEKLWTLAVTLIPQDEVANSPRNPEWNATKGKFGPFEDQFFVGDHTRSNIFRVSLQKAVGRCQGCVYDFMSGLQCGNISLIYDVEGALWGGQTCRGWPTRGSKPYGLQKNRLGWKNWFFAYCCKYIVIASAKYYRLHSRMFPA